MKKMKIFQGKHASRRPLEIIKQALDFVEHFFELNNKFEEIKKSQIDISNV